MDNRGNEIIFYKISDACKILGIKPGVLRTWDKNGSIKTIRTPGGQRLFDITSIDSGINIFKNKKKEEPICILYSRVSSAKQKNAIRRKNENYSFLSSLPEVKYWLRSEGSSQQSSSAQ